jgi:YHS domain-containing protein
MYMKKTISTAIAAMFILLHVQAQKSPVYVAGGKAIKGYDPVAFFTESKPLMGRDSLMLEWSGATWYFADRRNLEAFKAEPEKYAPQYGGYCAYGTAQGHKAPTEVETWTILDVKLYFNYNQKVKEAWSKDRPELIRKADENWPMIKDKE